MFCAQRVKRNRALGRVATTGKPLCPCIRREIEIQGGWRQVGSGVRAVCARRWQLQTAAAQSPQRRVFFSRVRCLPAALLFSLYNGGHATNAAGVAALARLFMQRWHGSRFRRSSPSQKGAKRPTQRNALSRVARALSRVTYWQRQSCNMLPGPL